MDPREIIEESRQQRHKKAVGQARVSDTRKGGVFAAGQDNNTGQPLVRAIGGSAVPVRSLSNIQPEIGQQGRSDGRGFDIGNRLLLGKKSRRPPLTNPDAKQLILIRRPMTDEIWVRSQTEAIKIYDGGRSLISFASLSSTGAKITDFIALISAGVWGADLGQLGNLGFREAGLIRWDGLASTVLYRAGFSEFYSIPFFPTTLCVAKRGFWVSYGSPGITVFPPPYTPGSFPSYWQVGRSSVQETTCYVATSPGIATYTLSLASDDYGSLESSAMQGFPGSLDQASGRTPVGLGSKKSGVRLLYDYPQDKFVYVRSGLNIGEVVPPTSGRIDSLEVSNTCFDQQSLYLGKLNPLDINKVIQSTYPIAAAYQDGFKIDTVLDFFEIPNSAGLAPTTIDPRTLGFSSLEFQDDLYVAIAFDLGERLPARSLGPAAPDTPPPPFSGGGGT